MLYIINQIKLRPTMYIGERSVHCLKAFLDGFVMGQEDSSECTRFMTEFQEWIQARFGVSTTQSWAQIVTFYSSDQCAALDKALNLLIEFGSAWRRQDGKPECG